MKKRARILLPILVLLVGIATAAAIIRSKPEVERQPGAVPAPLVRVVEVRLAPAPLNVRGQGSVEPRSEATLVAQVAGRIQRVARDFAAGAFFSRGQTLLWLEDADYRLAVAQAEAAVAQARVAVDREEAEAELAVSEWAELGEGEPSPLTRRAPQLAQARAALAAAEASLEQTRLNLERTRVTAPYDGRVRSKQADLGQFVGPGAPLATVYSTDAAEIRVPVASGDLAFLDLDLGRGDYGSDGPPVRLTAVAAGAPKSWTGRVVRADGGFDPRTRMLGLYVEVADPFGRRGGGEVLPMGLFVEAEIQGRVVEHAAVLPRSALRDGDRVLVVSDDRLRYRPVEVVRTMDEEVVVVGGLEAGELVCVSNLETVVDGMRVRALRDDEPLAARGRSLDDRVAGAMGPDARRRDAGDAGPSSRSGNAADGPMPPATRRATRGVGPPAALLVVDDGTASTPPRALHANRKPLSRDHPDSYHGLLNTERQREERL